VWPRVALTRRGSLSRGNVKPQRRHFLRLAASAAAIPVISRTSWAQAYPTRPITVVVPFAAGGGTDVAARIVAEHLSRTLGQQVIIENVGGAGGTTGSIRAMRAKPDGYTILMGHEGTHAFSVALYPNVDFEPIGVVVEQHLVIAARKDFPPKDLKEFAAYVKANVEKLNMAHAGVGSGTFTFGLLLNSVLGVKPTTVPFNGNAPAMNALVAGQVDYMLATVPEVGPQLQSGTVKAYAIGSAERNPTMPTVPTTKEGGLPEFQAPFWYALFAPKGTPGPILNMLTDSLDKALNDEDVRKRLLELGFDIPGGEKRGQQLLAALVKSEIARWTPIIKAANSKGQ
jgi:tripartite-type tricarboxylate transporter receptor subunit TctC